MTKKLYFIYAMLFKKISIISIDESLNGKSVYWLAHNESQDGKGRHRATMLFSKGKTPVDAVWNLKAKSNLKGVKL